MRPGSHRGRYSTRGFSEKRAPTLAADLDLLLGDLCVRWGFCNGLLGADLLEGRGGITADVFAQSVLRAETLDPDLEVEWRRAMNRVFVERYGGAEVSAECYTPAS